MIKLLHTADVHLDSPLKSLALRDPDLRDRVRTASRTALARIVDAALAEEVAAVLIAGDLFDGAERSARTAAFLVRQMERLRDAGIPVAMIKGNHDAENPLTGEVSLPPNVHVFDGRGGKLRVADEVWVHGVSFAQKHAPESLVPKFQAPVAGAVNIAMLHTSLAGADGHDAYAPCSLGDLTGAGFDYWALGHVHRRQVHAHDPWVVMPGTPQGRDIGEAGPKTATLLTIGDQITVEEVPTAEVVFLPLTVDAAGAETDDDLRARVRQAVRETAATLPADSAILRVTLTGATARRWQVLRDHDVWTETVAEAARETGRLWLEKLVIDLSDPAALGTGAVDELATIMAAIRAEPSFGDATLPRIEAILAELPPASRAALIPDEHALAALTDRLTSAGAERILARMKAAST